MKILVTGAYGFIGSQFVRSLLTGEVEKPIKVVTLDSLTYAGKTENLDPVRNDHRLVEVTGDIGDYALVSSLLHTHGIDTIINFAAESHVDRSIDSPERFFQTNVIGVVRLMEACRHYWKTLWGERKEAFRVLQVSTDEVYGSLGLDDAPFTERTPYAPNSPYAASKAGGDFVARSYFETYGLPVIITNCSNNYGPYQFPEKLIPLMIIKALRKEPLTIYGNGLNVRDWIHVEDHCSALREVIRDGRIGDTYNIGGNSERTNIEVVDAICSVLDEVLEPFGAEGHASLKAFVKDRPGHDQRYAIDGRKTAEELGWTPSRDFEDGIRETVHWYLNHSHWWQSILSRQYNGDRLGTAA